MCANRAHTEMNDLKREAALSRLTKILEMLEASPNEPFLHYSLGMEYVSAGDDVSAADSFHRATELSPDDSAPYFQHGQALVRMNEISAARQVLQQGIEAARRSQNQHAIEEMSGFLADLTDS